MYGNEIHVQTEPNEGGLIRRQSWRPIPRTDDDRLAKEEGRTSAQRFLSWLYCGGGALGAVGLALLLLIVLKPFFAVTAEPLFFVAVLGSTWYGGLGAGILATAAANFMLKDFLVPPLDSLSVGFPSVLGQMGLFTVTALALSVFADRRRSAEQGLHHVQERIAKLQRANEDLQQFATIVSHDLQEPLRTVANFVQRLAQRYQGQLDTDADEYIHFAVDGVARMQQRIQGLLVYTRIGSQERKVTVIDCEGLLQRVLQDLRVRIAESEAEVTSDPLPTVRADETQLGLVLQNLLSNALKFRREGSLRVHISAQRHRSEWVISVRDNGIGIDPRQAQRIFVIFQRLHTPREYPGTGIGLASCKRIIEQHGGRIWVESEPGQGATFYFTLPVL